MTTQNGGPDPVAFLYHRAIHDLFLVQDRDKQDRLFDPCFPAERGPKAKDCWKLFDDLIETYQWLLNHFNNSLKLYRDIRQQPQVAELIFRTRKVQRRRPYIEDTKAYIEKSRKLYLYLLQGLAPVTGKRTIKAYLGKVEDCRELWFKYGFTFDEIQAIPALIEDLQNELALIEVDRKPTFTESQQNEPKEQQAKVDEPTKPSKKVNVGRKFADWTQEDKKIIELSRQGMKPQAIASKLGLPYLVTSKRIRALKRRIKGGNSPG